jgi:hypothetical protein
LPLDWLAVGAGSIVIAAMPQDKIQAGTVMTGVVLPRRARRVDLRVNFAF